MSLQVLWGGDFWPQSSVSCDFRSRQLPGRPFIPALAVLSSRTIPCSLEFGLVGMATTRTVKLHHFDMGGDIVSLFAASSFGVFGPTWCQAHKTVLCVSGP